MAKADIRSKLKLKVKQSLLDLDASATPGFTGDEAKALVEISLLKARLIELQQRLYAEQKQSVLVVFQAMDTAGKDGVIRNVFSGVNPQGVSVCTFKRPSETELKHDFLWRVHAQAPEVGIVGVFNRSHYEDVLVVRVHKLATKLFWKARYAHIRAFESLLAHRGTKVIKFFLHIDLNEQKARLQDRLDDSKKTWKFEIGDLAERKLWPKYMRAYHDAIIQTDSSAAPWYVIPANKKWYRDLAVLRVLVAELEKMNPKYPKADFDPKTIVVE